MREILFRGKRIGNGEWVYGNFVRGCVDDFAYIVEFGNKELCRNYVDVIPKSIGEFTGLTDKKGKKIFEGDICRVTRHCILAYGEITFKKSSFLFEEFNTDSVLELSRAKINCFEIEIIGNIHDNPELLPK